jgi:phosphoribosylformylglycinamidine cyclo-ligase
MYADGEYDLAGFAVGVVGRKKIIDGTRVDTRCVAIALPSSGLHSNGYSLARRVLTGVMALDLDDRPDGLGGQTVGDALLTPTRLYARASQALLAASVDVRAMSHITGGGLPGNLPRVLPESLGVRIDAAWRRPAIFDVIARGGPVEEAEMRRTFNLGVGFVVIVPAAEHGNAIDALVAAGEAPFVLGPVVEVPAHTPFEARVVWP